ncbi:MAG: hypothetical protein DI529_16975 [Chryseobacterium sp.]|nr:MAG: hypothetical protein DI529_16975 [Chryseobacterium sp.]
MERIYKENNIYDKAYLISKQLDSLRKLENLEGKIAEMHLADKELLEKEQVKHENYLFWRRFGILIILITIFIIGTILSYRNSGKFKKDKQRMEEEMEQMKEELNYYSDNNLNENRENSYGEISQDFDKLTERQIDLLKLMAEGLSNKEIAEKLFITESTVKYHIKNIYSVLELKDRKDFFKKIRNNG